MPRILNPKIVLYLFVLVVFDLTVFSRLRLGDIFPIVVYLMVPYASFQWEWEKTYPVAIVIGIFRDLFGAGPIGMETGVLVAFSLVLDFAGNKIAKGSQINQLLFAFFFILFVNLGNLLVAGSAAGTSYLHWHALFSLMGSALLSALLMPFFFNFTARVFKDKTTLRQYELFG